ncbi:hydrogenase maturation protease [Legionella londiniensis]|uniref:Hydrogenase expression/formation protein n=1 Tax=Legionella londiniensis TaxID=45068 RepID=A0A0W0VT60_9GAMM|nr:hydrogenase maturation protease [Legionella londiniensis]KTD23234.1 hydrogenase expression/formation protein [Legionella londiniensis]STX93755.1 hydrogenase expression/formation protein [Legionella londiniensis]
MIKVLGIGSPFGDDSLGWEVVKQLQAQEVFQSVAPHQLQFIICDRPGLGLLQWMRGADVAFIVDAVQSHGSAGFVHRFEDEDILSLPNALSSHELGLAQAIQIGKAIEDLPEKLIFYGIEIDGASYDFQLKSIIKESIHELTQQMQQEIIQFLSHD